MAKLVQSTHSTRTLGGVDGGVHPLVHGSRQLVAYCGACWPVLDPSIDISEHGRRFEESQQLEEPDETLDT